MEGPVDVDRKVTVWFYKYEANASCQVVHPNNKATSSYTHQTNTLHRIQQPYTRLHTNHASVHLPRPRTVLQCEAVSFPH